MNYNKFIKSSVLASVVFLSACGDGPSESEVQDAMIKGLNSVFEQQKELMLGLGGGLGLTGGGTNKGLEKMLQQQVEDLSQQQLEAISNLKNARVDNTTERDDGSYSVVVTAETGGHSKTSVLIMVETEDGWRIIQ